MRRVRRRLRKSLPWLLAVVVVAGVGLVVWNATHLDADKIVAEAAALRDGDPDNGIPANPTVALDMLQRLLDREPEHYEAHIATAVCWARLRNFVDAVTHLEQARDLAALEDKMPLQVRAMRLGVNFLIADQEFDEAIQWARDIADLQPGNKLFQLNLGLALYNASRSIQDKLTVRFVSRTNTKDDDDVVIEETIEAFVADLWSEPDPEPVLDVLAPQAEASTRDELRDMLLAARTHFMEAADTMAEYPVITGFDQAVAKGYVELLLRSGRIYDAHITAAIALRQPSVNLGTRRALWNMQARCMLAIEEYGLAADLYEEIVNSWLGKEGWAPPVLTQSVIENRVKAGQWAWIADNVIMYRKRTGNDVLVQFAEAAALHATGQADAALEAILQPFSVISLGSRLPMSVRAHPTRRRDILLLSHDIFDALEDSRALDALDALLEQFPGDRDALLARCNMQRERGHLELAMADAFDLLSKNRRRPEDFELWLSIADELAQQRYDKTLVERAAEALEKTEDFEAANAQAVYEKSRSQGKRRFDNEDAALAYQPNDPALSWTIAQVRIPRNQLVRARNELRQLTQQHPQVQEFRLALAKILVREGKLESAVSEFRGILEDVPSDTEVLDLATRLEFALDDTESAARLVNEMILQDPLGVGAVRYGQQLLERGNPEEANELLKRLIRWPNFEPGRDLFLMWARSLIAVGDMDAATNILTNLATQYPRNEDVALLGLQVGLAAGDDGLTASAVDHLQSLATGLLPDQVADLSAELLETEDYRALLAVFPPEVRTVPVLHAALRPLAEAAKAVGDSRESDALLATLDDDESLRDRFLLLALQDRADEAGRQLRLTTVRESQEAEQDLCLLAASALTGFQALYDPVPVASLRELGLDAEYSRDRLELLDACLRLMPFVGRLDEVIPPELVEEPQRLYPQAGRDVARLIALSKAQPQRATRVLQSVLLQLLMNDRPFWARESRFLGEQILRDVPQLEVVSRIQARRCLDAHLASDALDILKYLLDPDALDSRTLAMFLEATRAFGHDEWGIALAYESRDKPQVRLLLAESLRERGFLDECIPHYLAFLDKHPADPQAMAGLVTTYAELRRPRDATKHARVAVGKHPDDPALARACLGALAELYTLEEDTVELIIELNKRHPDLIKPYETLARHHAGEGDMDALWAVLDRLAEQVRTQRVELWSEEAAENASAVRRAARISREQGDRDRARTLNDLALQLEPGSVAQFQELAFLELDAGRLDVARRYLEVLSIVRPFDREAPLALSRLLFEQVGQPNLAADVVRRTYGRQVMPPSAVEVLAAESYLRGDALAALEAFRKISRHPEVTADTILTVARIAFASRLDKEAALLFEQFITRARPDHPAHARAAAMLAICQGGSEDESGGLPSG